MFSKIEAQRMSFWNIAAQWTVTHNIVLEAASALLDLGDRAEGILDALLFDRNGRWLKGEQTPRSEFALLEWKISTRTPTANLR